MAEKKLPFYMKTHSCPACGSEGAHRQFRIRTYVPEEVESDTHVVTYSWSDPQLVQVHPPLYFLNFCTACFFTAPADNYIDPGNVLYGRMGYKAFIAAKTGGDKVIETLGRNIDYASLTFESALWMHLLSIYIQLLREEAMRDNYTIARLYLRVAWLFREESAAQSEAAPTPDVPEKTDDASQQAVTAALKEFDAALHQGRKSHDQILVALKADAERRGDQNAEDISKATSTMGRLLEALHSEAYRLGTAFEQSNATLADSGQKSYNGAFLDEIKALWAYTPMAETAALRSAIEYFEKAIASDARLNDPEPYFRTAALIIDLEIRCDDLDAAFKKVRGVIAAVMQDRQSILAKINETEEMSDKMDLKKVLVAANRCVEQATDLHENIIELVVKREMPKVKEILRDHGQSTAGQKRVALMANGISHGIIDHLQKRKVF